MCDESYLLYLMVALKIDTKVLVLQSFYFVFFIYLLYWNWINVFIYWNVSHKKYKMSKIYLRCMYVDYDTIKLFIKTLTWNDTLGLFMLNFVITIYMLWSYAVEYNEEPLAVCSYADRSERVQPIFRSLDLNHMFVHKPVWNPNNNKKKTAHSQLQI